MSTPSQISLGRAHISCYLALTLTEDVFTRPGGAAPGSITPASCGQVSGWSITGREKAQGSGSVGGSLISGARKRFYRETMKPEMVLQSRSPSSQGS